MNSIKFVKGTRIKEIEELAKKNGYEVKYLNMPNCTRNEILQEMNIKEFIQNNTENCEHPSQYILFLQRWSRQEPYWCLFIGETTKPITSEESNNYIILGHYCIEKESTLHDVMTTLAETGISVKMVHDYFS